MDSTALLSWCALQSDDHAVLHPEFGGIVRAGRMRDDLLVAFQEPHAVLAHRLEVRAARDEADVRAGLRKLDAQIAADRAGAEDADLHCAFLHMGSPALGSCAVLFAAARSKPKGSLAFCIWYA